MPSAYPPVHWLSKNVKKIQNAASQNNAKPASGPHRCYNYIILQAYYQLINAGNDKPTLMINVCLTPIQTFLPNIDLKYDAADKRKQRW